MFTLLIFMTWFCGYAFGVMTVAGAFAFIVHNRDKKREALSHARDLEEVSEQTPLYDQTKDRSRSTHLTTI